MTPAGATHPFDDSPPGYLGFARNNYGILTTINSFESPGVSLHVRHGSTSTRPILHSCAFSHTRAPWTWTWHEQPEVNAQGNTILMCHKRKRPAAKPSMSHT